MKEIFCGWLIVVAIASTSSLTVASCDAAEKLPNVVLILADDLGWSDTTLFGTTRFYKTPNIQRLAARGMTFKRAYASSPLCSPTRASILTGLSPARHGITSPTCHLPKIELKATPGTKSPPNKKSILPNSATRLDTKYYTLAEMFRENGFATGHFGKWHLGATPYSPSEHGFDVDVPHWAGPGPAGSYVAPWKFKDFDHDPDVPDQHIEDRMAKEAVAFMEAHKDQPFFLNYWMFSVHAPFDAKQKLIDQYKLRVDSKNPQRSPTYAAMIESMDDAVGTLLDTLDRLKIADNTIIIFASDNGGNMYNEVDGTTATSNAPLRGGKATMYEGGVRGPAIIVQLGFVAPNSRNDEIIQSSDFYPTLLELLSIEPKPDQEFDGISIVPALKGRSLKRKAIFTYFPHSPPVPEWLPPSVSVHQGDWKLIRIFFGGEAGSHRWKLFNLREDIGEKDDLSEKFPQRVKELDALVEEFLVKTNAVRPTANPNFDPSKYRPELEGKGKLRGSSEAPKKQSPQNKRAIKKSQAQPVAGWLPKGTCKLSLKERSLVVTSSGGDPHLSYQLPKPVFGKKLKLHLTMSSHSSGSGQFFWKEDGSSGFHRDRSMPFKVEHDGQPHEYVIEFSSANAVQVIRIDPSKAVGTIRLISVRLTNAAGDVQFEWGIK